MGASKAKKNKTAAAKQRRRTDRKAKSQRPSSAPRVLAAPRWTVPVWEYPRLATQMAEEEGITYEEALEVLLAEPIRMQFLVEHPESIAPREILQRKGMSAQEYIGRLTEMHRLGLIVWDELSHTHRSTNEGTVQTAPAATGSGRALGSAVEMLLDGGSLDGLNAAEKATIEKIDEIDVLLTGRGWALDPDSDYELVTWRFPTMDLPAGDTRGTGISVPPTTSSQYGAVLYTGDLGALRCEVEFPVPFVEGEYGRYSDYYSGFETPLEMVLSSVGLIEALRFGDDPGVLKRSVR